jgi:hypothetical protein
MTTALLESLERTRADYEVEQAWHRLLIDGYSGGGGFSGAVTQPEAGFWGAAAEIYSGIDVGSRRSSKVNRLTYLDRFPREDSPKFNARIDIAHYPNYIQALTDLKLSFVLRKPMTVTDRPPAVEEWREDIDGMGTTWDEILPEIALRAATVGWVPVIVDMPPAPVDENGDPRDLTRANADELGLRPTVVPLFPANLTDYQIGPTGQFDWAKIRTDHIEQPDPFGSTMAVTRYTIWFIDRFEQYEVTKDSHTGSRTAFATTPPGGVAHSFGEVPIAILTHKAALDDPVKGLPMHGQETTEAKRLFNCHSELDEHLRSQVFAVLVLAADENEEEGEVTVGTDNLLYLDPNSSNQHYYMAPPGTVAQAYETRIETIIQELYRMARVEFTRPGATRQAVSGVARKFEFAQTNAALAIFAQSIARFEEHIDFLVAIASGVSEEEAEQERITAPQSFDIDDLQEELQLAMDAITGLTVGATAERLLRERVIKQLIPNMSDEDATAVEEELAEVSDDQGREQQMQEEINRALTEREQQPPPPTEEDEELGGAEPAQR